ncbi:MAG: class I tRNA ligase family protein [Patescibacteria group bacterium]|nr:class I tRNA ligase family protein [Patescibacteria group bacterium]
MKFNFSNNPSRNSANSVAGREEKILKFWEKNKIFEKSVKQRVNKQNFVFYEGPPYANGKPGIHHLLARAFKDIILRYKTMKGFLVERKAGWDTHGLPTEMESEKKLKIKSKKEIEKIGIAKFVRECKRNVFIYKKEWENFTKRIGFWIDLENPYITCANDYMETVWWTIKQIWEKGLLYKDYKVVPYCPRCGTSLSSHEVAQGYKKVKDLTVYVKFKLENQKNTYFLIWTTTPWTLPGNIAIAVNPKFTYSKVRVNKEILILAKERIKECGIKADAIEEVKGRELIGLKYTPIYPYQDKSKKAFSKSYEVISGNFISLEEGTGIVHIAPAFGEDDMNVIQEANQKSKNKFPILITVNDEGKMTTPGYKWDNIFVKKADALIISDIESKKLLFAKETYEHDYPFCWRCGTPLIYYAKESWFINMKSVKKDLIQNNQKINWIPRYLKNGRVGEWLNNVRDWTLSRERYWGTPMPIWQCQECGHIEVIGSKKDLINQRFSSNRYFILRHGETLYQISKKGIIYPSYEKNSIALHPIGREHIKKQAKKLKILLKNKKIDLIYSSDATRTFETAEIVSKEFGSKVIPDKRLRDTDFGIYFGKTEEEFKKYYPESIDRFSKKITKGDSWNGCRKRVLECINDIDEKNENKIILIVSHRDPLWLIEGAMNGLSDEKLLRQRVKDTLVRPGEIRRIKFKRIPVNEKGEIDFHRPYIDDLKFSCPKCHKKMKRINEVVDCWFDSGSMPFAQYHYPFASNSVISQSSDNYGIENKKLSIQLPRNFPADFICEGIDQTRGWFYTLLAISTLLGFKTPYKNVISLGLVLDENGEKMSKSRGNAVEPWDIVNKYGADAVRWYFYRINQPGDFKLFSEKDAEQCLKNFIFCLWNCYTFFETYVSKKDLSELNFKILKSNNVLDRWIISKFNVLIKQATQRLDEYDINSAVHLIEAFVIEDFSQWYIRRSRKRFHRKSGENQCKGKKEFQNASQTYAFILLNLSKIIAPFAPFLAEELYKKLNQKFLSVHLTDYPISDEARIDKKLERKMAETREILSFILFERKKAGIKVRQPLGELKIRDCKLKGETELLELIKEEANIKKIVWDSNLKNEIELDTKITDELREEGFVREIIRSFQEMRKTAGLCPNTKISVYILAENFLKDILDKNKLYIIKEVNISSFDFVKNKKKRFDKEKTININGKNLWLAILKK